MNEEITHARFKAAQTFVIQNSARGINDDDLLLDKLVPCIKSLLGPSLENRIHSLLEEFVCNSGSRYARRFPRVKKLLDVLAAWADCFDAFAKDTDIREEMIKHAMKYLAKDGLVTRFADPVVLNSGPNNVDPDSLGAEQDALKSMNVWRFINEKDYWLCQDCAVPAANGSRSSAQVPESSSKDICNSDLDVEIGSLSKGSSTVYCSCGTGTASACNACSHLEDDRAQSCPDKHGCRNVEMILRSNKNLPNPQPDNPNNCTTLDPCPKEEKPQKIDTGTNCGCGLPDTKSFEAQTNLSGPGLNSIQGTSHCSKGTGHDFPHPTDFPAKENAEASDVATGPSKLKIYVHRTTSIACHKVRSPARVSNLSLPCKSSHLIVRLFEADPTLSDSCLILMRKKFEKDIRNACSCINDILSKLEAAAIQQLRLHCLIRPGRVDLNLQRRNGGARRFLARVPTCSNVHKRDSRRDGNGNRDTRDRSEVPPVADPRCCTGTPNGGHEGRQATFFSICSNLSLAEDRRACPLARDLEKGHREVTLVWTRRRDRWVGFAHPLGSMTCRRNGDPVAEERRDEVCAGQESCQVFLDEGNGMAATEIVERRDSDDGNQASRLNESCDSNRTCFNAESPTEDSSSDACDPEHCLCRVFCSVERDDSSRTIDTGTRDQAESSRGLASEGDRICCSTEEIPGSKKSEERGPQQKDEPRRNAAGPGKTVSFAEEAAPLPGESRKLSPRRNASKSLEAKDTYSLDSICVTSTDNSHDTKCSCCGNELSNPTFAEGTDLHDDANHSDHRETIVSAKIETPSAIPVEDPCVVENSSACFSSCKIKGEPSKPVEFKMDPRTVQEANMESFVRDGSCGHDDNRSNRPPQQAAENCPRFTVHRPDSEPSNVPAENRSGSPKFCVEKKPSMPESLFVFCRQTDLAQSSSASGTFMDDDEAAPNDCFCHARNQPRRSKWKSLGDRAISRSFNGRTNRTNYSAGCKPSCSAKRKAERCKTEEEENADEVGPRCRSRQWRGSVLPGSLCGSFPAVDRIKYLIRKKLRGLLLEERDKGTSTSKTFLRTDRYLVSISSGKLNGAGIIRGSCSTRCPFTTRNRYESGGAPGSTFTEGSLPRRKREALGVRVKERCRRKGSQGQDESKRIRISRVPGFLGRKCSCKSTDTRDLIGVRAEILSGRRFEARNEERCPANAFDEVRDRGQRSPILSLDSRDAILSRDNEDFSTRRILREKSCNRRANDPDGCRKFLGQANSLKVGCAGRDRVPMDETEEGRTIYRDSRRDRRGSFEKRGFKICQGSSTLQDYNFVSFLTDYEKRINQLDADFRLKLLQYVTLCRSVKNSLIKRLQTDDVYEVSSSSMWGRKSFRD